MSKRQKFVIATLVLLAGIVAIRLFPGVLIQWRFRVAIFSLLAVLASVWALFDEDFAGVEWVILPILPAMFAVSAAVVFPLLPTGFDLIAQVPLSPDAGSLLGLLVRIAHLGVFVVGYYAALLTTNIYNVAAIRTIQLLRVAHSIGFLVTVATALFFYIVISAFHLSSFLNFLAVFGVTLPLAFQSLWSVNLEEKVSGQTRNFALLTAIVLGQIAWALSFWPIGVSIFALFLTAIFYELIGIIQYHFGERLSPRIANEFVLVAVVMFFVVVFTTRWGS
ncbi:hypothetical protein HY440_02320 [Candidatus Microgenomates bacterium]|nr:hypothetical protein [Candidatus Microgenomates bacterium]